MECSEKLRVHVRWMIRRDMPYVLEHDGDNPDRWTETEFLESLRRRNHIGMVAEQGEDVLGHMVYELGKRKLVIVSFAVGLPFRRRGGGSAMVEKLKVKLSAHQRTKIRVDVPERNTRFLLFLKKQGFRATSLVKNGYDRDDDIAMVYALQETQRANVE